MINKKKLALIIGIFIIIILGIVFIFRVFTGEDSWIKDEKGRWIMHGNPANIPDEVKEQKDVISCASELYAAESLKNATFSSQCLGICNFGEGYAVDIVHVPRTSEDNLQENQCADYREGKVKHFIELNSQGNIVRIVD
jgi:hypothetical protein